MGYFKQLAGKLLAYNDGSEAAPGLDRIQIGDLSPFTDALGHTSPGGPNMRVLDSSSLLVMDAFGLVSQFESLGFAANGINQSTTGLTFVDVTTSQFSLTVKRPSRIFWPLVVTGKITAGANNGLANGVLTKVDDGTTLVGTAAIIIGTSQYSTGFMWYFAGKGATLPVIPAGTYTAKLQMAADNAGTTFNVIQFFHQIFLCGG